MRSKNTFSKPQPDSASYGRGGGLNNERLGSGHVILGPMRGLKSYYMKRGHQTDRHRDSMINSAQRVKLVKI